MSQSKAALKGMLELDQLRELVVHEQIETVVVGFTDHYGRMLGKRYDAEMFVEDIASGGAHGCNYLLTTDMEMDPVKGYSFANWELGYGDVHLAPIRTPSGSQAGSTRPRSSCATCGASRRTTT